MYTLEAFPHTICKESLYSDGPKFYKYPQNK